MVPVLPVSEAPVRIKIEREAFGWRLAEARMSDNSPVPRVFRGKIEALLAQQGVRIGDKACQLQLLRQFIEDNEFDLLYDIDLDEFMNDAA